MLAGMIETWGGETIDYPERRHCCGFGFRNYLVQANRGYSIANTHKKLESMAPYKPDFIVSNCPGCPMFLDRWQYAVAEMEGITYGEKGQGIPVLTYEEMAGLVLGYDPWALGLQMHQVNVEPLLDKMGIRYDGGRPNTWAATVNSSGNRPPRRSTSAHRSWSIISKWDETTRSDYHRRRCGRHCDGAAPRGVGYPPDHH